METPRSPLDLTLWSWEARLVLEGFLEAVSLFCPEAGRKKEGRPGEMRAGPTQGSKRSGPRCQGHHPSTRKEPEAGSAPAWELETLEGVVIAPWCLQGLWAVGGVALKFPRHLGPEPGRGLARPRPPGPQAGGAFQRRRGASEDRAACTWGHTLLGGLHTAQLTGEVRQGFQVEGVQAAR